MAVTRKKNTRGQNNNAPQNNDDLNPVDELDVDALFLQLGIEDAKQLEHLEEEGVTDVAALLDLESKDWDAIQKSSQVSRYDQNDHLPPRNIPRVMIKRLAICSEILRHCVAIQKKPELTMLTKASVRDFERQWKIIEEKAKRTPPDVPKMTQNMKPEKWLETFFAHLGQVYGTNKVPLSYLVREVVSPDYSARTFEENKAYSKEAGSVERERILSIPHDGVEILDDKKDLYNLFDSALTGTTYSNICTSHKRTEDGQAVACSFKGAYAGASRYEEAAKEAEKNARSIKWSENGRITLRVC